MKLYCIIRKQDDISNSDTYALLKKAADARGVEFIPIESDNFDYVRGLSVLETNAIMYRMGRGDRAALLQVLMASKGIIGLFKNVDALLSRNFSWGSAIRMEQAGLPIIPTIFNISKNEDSRLKEYVEELGGFPIIVKSSGGSHGEGVMKIDSISSLRSVVGFISDTQSATFVLRKFVNSARHLRLVVVGNKVVDTIEYDTQSDDFRTNAVAVPTVVDRNDVNNDIKQIAIKAVAALDLEFGGVDVLIDESGTAYVAEVNFPCNFARNQMNTGTDVAGQLVDYLVEKARIIA
ncbi:RimK family alpha-L-glutamate ligase [soil metagenome]